MNTLIGTKSINGKSNAPGLRQLRLILVDRVRGIKVNKDLWCIPLGGIEVTSASDVVNIPFVNGMYSEPSETNEHGEAFRGTIDIEVPRDSTEQTMAINSYRGKKLIALIKDKNGTCKVIGTLKQPLKLVGINKESTNIWQVQFSTLTPAPSYFTDGISLFTVNSQFVTL